MESDEIKKNRRLKFLKKTGNSDGSYINNVNSYNNAINQSNKITSETIIDKTNIDFNINHNKDINSINNLDKHKNINNNTVKKDYNKIYNVIKSINKNIETINKFKFIVLVIFSLYVQIFTSNEISDLIFEEKKIILTLFILIEFTCFYLLYTYDKIKIKTLNFNNIDKYESDMVNTNTDNDSPDFISNISSNKVLVNKLKVLEKLANVYNKFVRII